MSTTINAGNATTGAAISADTTGILQLQSGSTPTTALTIDASQNVGIGTSSPTAKLDVNGGFLQVETAGTATGRFGSSTYITTGSGTDLVIQNVQSGSNTVFVGGSNERMRIDSAGRILFNLTAPFDGFGNTFSWYSAGGMQLSRSANGDQIGFYINGTFCGKISSSGSTTTYATSSDYRLKEDIAPMTNALATVSALKPVTYKWKTDGFTSQGFIAHELQEFVPECVVGEKDAVDEKGNPQYQGIDTSFLVATLTAAIQEQQALIESLTTRLTALEIK